MKSDKLRLITTIVLAVTAVITAGFAAYGISETRRTVESQEQMVELTRDMMETGRLAATTNNETLQAELLIQRYKVLHELWVEHRETYYMVFAEHIGDLAEQTAGAPTGFQLVNDESLCSTLGSYEWVCTTFHEYDEVWHDSSKILFAIVRSLQIRDFESAAQQLDALDDSLNELGHLYGEVFWPG